MCRAKWGTNEVMKGAKQRRSVRYNSKAQKKNGVKHDLSEVGAQQRSLRRMTNCVGKRVKPDVVYRKR